MIQNIMANGFRALAAYVYVFAVITLVLYFVASIANGSPLTDIYVGNYSIPMIMTIWGNWDFIGAMDVIAEYINGNTDIAERRIWRTFR